MPAVNPQILVWARETAGLALQDAASRVGIRDARGVAAVDRLRALERGEQEPTRPILVKMARHYRRPLLAFYLTSPPQRGDRGADFRTLRAARSSETDALVDALVRNVRGRQNMVRAALEAEDEADRVPFVGVLSGVEGARQLMESPRGVLSRSDVARLVRHAVAALNQVLGEDLSATTYYKQPSAGQAFALLRTRTEGAGAFVLLQGDLGSPQTAIDVEVFRGFAIADDFAPFVVINDRDSRAAWSFTLLHELTHLLLGQTGISGGHLGNEIEEFCNNVAAEWMLPTPVLDEIEVDADQDVARQQQRISEFARGRNLSRTMVAYRLLRAKRIDSQIFDLLRAAFGEGWRQERERQRARARESVGGPDYYTVRRHRVGQGLLTFSRRMVDSGALSTTKAARILGVKPPQVGRMLRPTRAR